MSGTPRTDAASYQISKEAVGLIMTPIKVARQLEHELTTANATITNLRADITELLERLREHTESHLAASARDVRTIQLQHIALIQIHNLTYDWADGAPDATAHDKLANEISSITHTFI